MEENELYDRIGESDLNPNYKDGQVYQHEDVNNMISIFKTAINENYHDIQKLKNGETNVGSAGSVDGATVSRYLDEELQADDNKVPSSQQAKAYMDNLFAEYSAPVRGVDYWTDEDKQEIIDDTKTDILSNDMGSIIVDDVNCKNLFDKSTIVAGDYTNANPTIRLSSRQIIPVKAGETYTASSDIDTSIYNYVVSVLPNVPPRSSYDETQNTGWISSSSVTLTITTSGYLVISVRKSNNSTLSVSDIASANFQLEKGSTATESIPYKKIIKEANGYVKENTTFYANDFKCKNLCNGINQSVFLTSAVSSGQVLSGNTGLYIKVNGGKYTISTTASQSRYRVACSTNEPSTTAQTAYNGVNADGTSNTITIDTSGYNYLIVNATDLSKIQIEPGSEATSYTPYKNFDNTEYVLYDGGDDGSNTDITLSDSVVNYAYIEVFGRTNDGYRTSVKILNPNSKQFELQGTYIPSIGAASTTSYMKITKYSISGNTITVGGYVEFTIGNNTNIQISTANNRCYITKVVGYK